VAIASVDGHLEMRQSAQKIRTLVLERRAGVRKAQFGEALQHGANRDRTLKARETGTQAEMDSLAKRQMVVGGARDIELVRVREMRGIAVRRRYHHEYARVRLQIGATEVDVVRYRADRRLYGPVVAQHLFDRIRHQFGLAAQRRDLVRIARQRQRPVADQIGGGLVAGQQQQQNELQQLARAQRFALFVRGDERAYQVGSRLRAALFNFLQKIGAQLAHRGLDVLGLGMPGRTLS